MVQFSFRHNNSESVKLFQYYGVSSVVRKQIQTSSSIFFFNKFDHILLPCKQLTST